MLAIVDDYLWIEGCRAADLARRFGTPLYVVSENQVRRNARSIREAFSRHWHAGPVRLLPSEKASLSLAVRRILVQEGAGCDTFGPGELHAALRCGVPPALISVNGTGKDAALIRQAIAAGARITLDSAVELEMAATFAAELGRTAHVRLRVRPDYVALEEESEFRPGHAIREVADSYKPGIPADLVEALGAQALRLPQLHLSGLMAHLGRHRAEAGVWAKMAASFGRLVGALCRSWGGWQPEELDVGGGFAAPRDPTSPDFRPAPPIEDIAAAVTSALAAELAAAGVRTDGVTLEVEPGRSLFANTGVHLARVRHVKQQRLPQPRSWIETDTSEIFLPDLFAEHAHFRPVFASRAAAVHAGAADIVGVSCNFDVLCADVPCPELAPGDVIAFLDTGAYQDAGASNFNAMPRPGVVLVTDDRAEWIKRPETVEDVFARDLVPERLR